MTVIMHRKKRRVTYADSYVSCVNAWNRQYDRLRSKWARKRAHLPTDMTFHSVNTARVEAEACVADRPITIRHVDGQYELFVKEIGIDAYQALKELLTFIPEQKFLERLNQAPRNKYRPIPLKKYPVFEIDTDRKTIRIPAFVGRVLYGPCTINDDVDGVDIQVPKPRIQLLNERFRRQVQASKNVKAFWRSHAPGGAATCCLEMPCGSGKTFTAIFTAITEGKRVAVLVHQETLITQMRESAEAMFPGIRVGIVQGKGTVEAESELYDLVIFSIPTLSAWMRKFGRIATQKRIQAHTYGTLIGDEAHHMAAQGFSKIVSLFGARRRLWLTATPERDDKLVSELEWITGPTVFKGEKRPGALNVALVKFPAWNRVLHRLPSGDVDFPQMQLDSATDVRRNAWAVDLIGHLLDEGRTILVNCCRAAAQVGVLTRMIYESRRGKADFRHRQPDFFDTRGHRIKVRKGKADSRSPAPLYQEATDGPLVSTIQSKPKDTKEFLALNDLEGVVAHVSSRKSRAVDRYRNFRIRWSRVIVAHMSNYCDGFDMKICDTALFLGSYKSEINTIQGVERVARIHDGKKMPWVIDVADVLSPSTGSQRTSMFLNVQRQRKMVFEKQMYPFRSFSVDPEDSKTGTCPAGWWSAIRDSLPQSVQESRAMMSVVDSVEQYESYLGMDRHQQQAATEQME